MEKVLKRILYVEDDPDIQVVGKLALEAVGGYEVVVCTSGREALEVIDGQAPDLVLLDVMMPELDGPSTLRALRALPRFAALPVVFMTAKVQADEVMAYKELGAIGVIAKPFDPMQLSDKVRSIWGEHHAQQRG